MATVGEQLAARDRAARFGRARAGERANRAAFGPRYKIRGAPARATPRRGGGAAGRATRAAFGSTTRNPAGSSASERG